MESWCFDSMDKGFVLNETLSSSDSLIRNKNVMLNWELKPPFSYENSVLFSSQQSVHNSCFPELMRKQFPHDSTRNVMDGNANVGDILSPSLVTSKAISGDEESSSKFSSSVMDSNSRNSSLIDLKLSGFGDKPNCNSNSRANVLSSAESSSPAKRARVSSLGSQTAYCQVYGCHKDLSSAKDYHKRHKVCDVHSKTSKVIVNGVEKRFCQQCSRFHLLGEFDDGKRSCRKRLAGHNERRRKPQVGFSNRNGRSLHSYTGSNFQMYTPTSKYGSNDWVKHVKVENGTDYAQEQAYNCIYGQLQPKFDAPSYKFENHFPFADNTDNTGPKSVFGENVTQYTPQTVSPRSEDLTLLDAASTVERLPGISESGCALSLLSSQSRNSSGHSSRMPEPEVHPLMIPSSSPHYSMNEVSEKFFGIQNRNASGGVTSMGRNQPRSMLMHSNGDTAHFDFGNVMHHSEFMNMKDHLSCEVGTTVDLLQLSSQLQRVENQRQLEPLKHETEGSCCRRMT
ncbi:Squamosa promoter-binding-like protein 6 [Bienertia sinuspersici]